MNLNIKDTPGVREHLMDSLIEMDAEDTPLFSLCPKGEKPRAPTLQQPVDKASYTSKRGVANKTPAGANKDKFKDYKILKSNIQWIRETVGIGEKDEVNADLAGVGLGKLYAKSVAKGLSSMKVAIDGILGDEEDQVDEDGDIGSETRGFVCWGSPTAQSVDPVPEKYRPKAEQYVECTLGEVTPDTIKAVLNARYKKTRKKGKFLGFCGVGFKSKASEWSTYLPEKESSTTVRRFDSDVTREERVLSALIDVLVFDAGTVELHLTPNLLTNRDDDEETEMSDLSSNSLLVLPQDSMSIHFSQELVHKPLPYDGGSVQGVLSTMFGTMAKPFDIGVVKCAS